MKPFDLEAALAGAKVITKDGREVKQLTKFDTDISRCLVGVVDKLLLSWFEDGRYERNGSNSDLFMASTTRAVWIARYGNYLNVRNLCSTEAECISADPLASEYHKIEWEQSDETI